MKKLFLLFMMVVGVLSFAQTQAGNSFVGLNSSNIGFNTVQDSGVKNYSLGLQVGHFLVNKLAVIGSAGYDWTRVKDLGTTSEAISYQVGFKYYVENVLPVQIDYNGVEKQNYFGTQLGYAFFPSTNFSIEPTLRYDIALKEDYNNKFSFGFGFNYFFK